MRAAAPDEAMDATVMVASHYDRSICSHALFASENQAANVTGRRSTGAFESRAFVQFEGNKMMKDEHAARALRQANELFKQVDATKEVSDYEKAQQSFHENRER